MAKFCPECAHPIIDGKSQFCPKCGVKLPVICPGCAHPIVVDNSQFCPKCGMKLPVTFPEVQPPAARPTTVQQPNYPSNSISTASASPPSVQIPAQQQQNPIVKSPTQKRSTFDWIAICCGGIILLIVISGGYDYIVSHGGIAGMATGDPTFTGDKIITTDLSAMALTINDLPTGWTVSQPAAIKNGNFSVNFMRVSGFSGNFVYLDIFKYPTVESAKTAYQSDKAQITKYKVESVYLGNEGYGYVDNQASNVVFRKGNIIVKTLYSESSIGGFSSDLSISDSKDYAKIVADRTN